MLGKATSKLVNRIQIVKGTYLASANDAGRVSGWDFTKHVIAKNEKTSTPTPFAFNMPF